MCTEWLWNGKNEENGTEVKHGQFTGTAAAGQSLRPSFRTPLSQLDSAKILLDSSFFCIGCASCISGVVCIWKGTPMAVHIRKHPLEIPLPSEKDWLKDDEEDFFLQDPEREHDALPQPVRMVTKLVMLVFDDAMEIIERRERLREAEKLKVKPTEFFATAEFQVTATATCLAVSGKYIFVGLSVGLAAFKVSDYTEVCTWDAVKTEIGVIHALDLGNEVHILFAVDEMGLVCLFCFHKESFLLIKILNEVEDISKRSTCVELVLSPRGDYAGVLLQDSTKAWLEIYRLPKDSWLKKMEESPGAALGLMSGERRSSQASAKSLELHKDGSAQMVTNLNECPELLRGI